MAVIDKKRKGKSSLYSNNMNFSGQKEALLTYLEVKELYDSQIRALLDELKIILGKPIQLRNKQRCIEKLFNVFIFNKKINKFEGNRSLVNALLIEYSREIASFSGYYQGSLKKGLRLQNSKFDLFGLLACEDIFIFICLILLSNKEFLDKNAMLQITFRSLLVDKFFVYFDNILKVEVIHTSFYMFVKEMCMGDENNSLFYLLPHLSSGSFMSNNKSDYSKDWSVVLLALLNKNINKSVTRRHGVFRQFKQTFLRFFSTYKVEVLAGIVTMYIPACLDALFSIGIFTSFRERLQKKKLDYLQLADTVKFSKLSSLFLNILNLPMICKPLNWSKSGESGGYLLNKQSKASSLVKENSEGSSKFTLSASIISSINLLQQKEYVVDTEASILIKSNLFKKQLGVPEFQDIYSLYKNSVILNNEYISKIKNIDYQEYFEKAHAIRKLGASDSLETRKQLLELRNAYGLTDTLFDLSKRVKESRGLYLSKLRIYLEYAFNLLYVDLFKEFSLYIVNRLDFRGRIIPVGRLTRASGFYKNLIKPKDAIKFTYTDRSNFKWLAISIMDSLGTKATKLKNYLSNFENKTFIWSNSGRVTKDFLLVFELIFTKCGFLDQFYEKLPEFPLNFFQKNIIKGVYRVLTTPGVGEKIFNLFFGVRDYLRYLQNPDYISTHSISIGQSASGPMIYAFLNKDSLLLKLTGAVSTTKWDLYTHFSNQLANEITDKCLLGENTIKVAAKINTRSFGKSIIMPTFYNMQATGILNVLSEVFKDVGIKRKDLFLLSDFIYNKLRVLYPFTIGYRDWLVELVRVCLFKNSFNVDIRTLDDGLFSYCYKNSKKVSKRIKLPVGKFHTVDTFLPKSISNRRLNKKHYESFPANLIKSIDAGICRLSMLYFYNITGCLAEPLHDSFKLPIVYIDSFICLLKYLYIILFFPEFNDKVFLVRVVDNDGKVKLTIKKSAEEGVIYFDELTLIKRYTSMFSYTEDINFLNYINPVLYHIFLSPSIFDKDLNTLVDFRRYYLNLKRLIDTEVCRRGFSNEKTVDRIIKSTFMFFV